MLPSLEVHNKTLIIAKSIQPGLRFHQWDVSKIPYVLAPAPNEIYIEQPVMKQYQEGDPKEFVFRLIQSLFEVTVERAVLSIWVRISFWK